MTTPDPTLSWAVALAAVDQSVLEDFNASCRGRRQASAHRSTFGPEWAPQPVRIGTRPGWREERERLILDTCHLVKGITDHLGERAIIRNAPTGARAAVHEAHGRAAAQSELWAQLAECAGVDPAAAAVVGVLAPGWGPNTGDAWRALLELAPLAASVRGAR